VCVCVCVRMIVNCSVKRYRNVDCLRTVRYSVVMLYGISLRTSYVVTFEVGSKISEGHTLYRDHVV
jgi:hypothetical protein